MAQSRISSLSQLLKGAKSGLATAMSGHKNPVTLVIGNQSADLDSFTSSVVYAYFRTQKLHQVSVPVLNIPEADLAIRPEFRELMRHADIDPRVLTTLDDLGPSNQYIETLPPEQTRWVLMDHNKLEGRLGQVYGQRVVGVIDHHEDENAVPDRTDPEPRVIQVCGSCTSLVIREVKSKWDELRHGDPPALDAENSARIAKFAMASILIDTRNLQNPDKTTMEDVEAVQYLEKKIAEAGGNENWSNENFFREIKEAKNNISDISAQGVFRKDYKEWEENGISLGTSSAVKRLHKLAKKVNKEQNGNPDAWKIAASQFMNDREVDIWLVLTSFNDEDGAHRRELALHWTKAELKDIADRFEEAYGQELQLERSKVGSLPINDGPEGRRTWLQRNGAMSRKQVAPMIRRIIRGE